MSFHRWMSDFDPIIPDLDFDLSELPTDPMLLSASRAEWAAMQTAAVLAFSDDHDAAERRRAEAGYGNLNTVRRTYWPHDNDPED